MAGTLAVRNPCRLRHLGLVREKMMAPSLLTTATGAHQIEPWFPPTDWDDQLAVP